MILVTGGAGLVGNEIINRLLKSGRRVRAIYNTTSIDIEDDNLEKINCSILDVVGLEEIFSGIKHVYHCAGYVSFNSNDTEILEKINVEGTSNIVNAAIEEGIEKLIHVSSVAAMGKNYNGDPITEETFWIPGKNTSKYGQSKYLGEMEVWRGIAEGLNAVIVNPSVILGPGNWDYGSSAIFKTAYNEFPYYTDGATGFVDVKDVVSIMIYLMESNISGERFILNASNENYKDIFKEIALCFNKRPPFKKVKPWQVAVVWRMNKLKTLFGSGKGLLTKETALSAQKIIYYNNSKLLKFMPGFTYRPIKQTIAETCYLLQQKVNKH